MSLRIAVLECDTPIDPLRERYGTYGDFFKRLLHTSLQELGKDETNLHITKWDVVNNTNYPDPKEYDALLLSGSKYDAWSDEPWILSLTDYVKRIHAQQGTPIVGICFGHQIVARALGMRVGRSDAGWEIAVLPISLGEAGRKLFQRDTLSLHQMHRDIVIEVPKECANLGSTVLCEVQGLYQPQRLLTVQGHPEYDEFVETKLIEMRTAAGVFDPELSRDGLARVGKAHDGVVSVFEHPGHSVEDARKIAVDSLQAFQSFKKSSLNERKALATKALGIIDANKETLAQELSAQMGRPIAFAIKEVETMLKRAEYLIGKADESLKDYQGEPESGFRRFLKKKPLGVTLLVTPWNYPYLVTINTLLPSLLCGNTVILRPSPQTPLVGERLHTYFTQAGFPPNVFQLLHVGSPDVLDAVVQIPEISFVSFTGSTAGGVRLREATAKRILPVNLELGGNDPAYVRPDADLKYVAEQLVDGAVFNQGQSCCAIERVYVHADVHDAFVAEVQKELASYKLGDPAATSTTVGPVISQAALNNIKAHVADALAKGAKDVTPANETFANPPAQGNYLAPVVLTGVNHEMEVMKEETFGPVMPIMKVSSDEEAVRLMNDSDYGLTASVWTKDIARGEELVEEIEAGTVYINRADYPSPDLAWIGWKNSGLGCTLGPHAFEAFYKLKSFHIREKQG
ncbi:Aldedh-domain-containing protein [Aspergillus taichungensis]|uniref:aldehyde dehydrogenase (NAD(+)) n=1 Tax=Aspergillus taichungensis TaxID=482145 RepID=A0A2J5HQ74_9EURO|nr:Aldedh-domain-containing protein [Aspergillus taichungensis]